MGLLQLAVLGSPEVLHDGSRLAFPLRKAQALLFYLHISAEVTLLTLQVSRRFSTR